MSAMWFHIQIWTAEAVLGAYLVQSLIGEDQSIQMWALLLGKNIDYSTGRKIKRVLSILLFTDSSQYYFLEVFIANISLFILPLSWPKGFSYIWKKISTHLNRNWLIHSRTFGKLAIVNKRRIVFPKTMLLCVNQSLSIGWARSTNID